MNNSLKSKADLLIYDEKFEQVFSKYFSRNILVNYYDQYVQDTYCITYFDIDGLATCNGDHTIEQADKAFQHIVQLIKDHFPEDSIICRIGGDEFIIINNNMLQEDCDKFIKQAKLAIENADIKKTKGLSASFACADNTNFDSINSIIDFMEFSDDIVMEKMKEEMQGKKKELKIKQLVENIYFMDALDLSLRKFAKGFFETDKEAYSSQGQTRAIEEIRQTFAEEESER